LRAEAGRGLRRMAEPSPSPAGAAPR
jgi:hypothetical protein